MPISIDGLLRAESRQAINRCERRNILSGYNGEIDRRGHQSSHIVSPYSSQEIMHVYLKSSSDIISWRLRQSEAIRRFR